MPHSPVPAPDHAALVRLGHAVRALRREHGWSRADLASRSDLSPRFLAQLETGSGNISFLNLRRLAQALGTDTVTLVGRAERGAGSVIALLGMRGAGKSTIGRMLAARMELPFRELDDLVEDEAGLTLGQVFELQGSAYYRRMEREALTRFLESGEAGVLATGGGIVTARETYSTLRRRAFTVWLKASPQAHWDRVVRQGDRRPMEGLPDAMAELRRLWETRAPLYAEADLTVDTDAESLESVVEIIAESVAGATV